MSLGSAGHARAGARRASGGGYSGCHRNGHEQLASGVDLGYAHGIAEDYVRAAGAQALAAPYARWRGKPMNGAQAGELRRLGVTPRDGVTKGEASDLITVARAAAALERLSRRAA